MRALPGSEAGSVRKESIAGRQTRWVADVTVVLGDGTRHRVRARGLTAHEAVAKRDARVEAIRERGPSRLTVRGLSERWLAARAHALKPATVKSYRQALDLYILPEIGGRPVTDVTPMEAQAVISAVLARSGRSDMRAAADRARRVMSAMFRQSVAWQLRTVSPVDAVPAVRPAYRERGYWTRDEATAFLTAARSSGYYPLFLAALTTGLRLGELLALSWDDVDAEAITVRRSGEGSPKSAAGRRRVPLPRALRDTLGPRGRGLVFPSRSGRALTPSSVRRAMDRIQGGIEVPRLRFHDLRRTYASLLAAGGHHPAVIQRLLGHASPDLALRVYTSVTDATLATATVDLVPLEPMPAPSKHRGATGAVIGATRTRQGARRATKVDSGREGDRASGTARVPRGARSRKGTVGDS